jgi:hypothetical protein
MHHGLDTVLSEYLRCEQLRQDLLTLCPNQLPQLPTYNADEGLYLAKNRAWAARPTPWFGTSAASEVERLTAWFQPTPQLDQLVERSRVARGVAVVGAAGTGKSALAAGLARPEVTEGAVPERFVQAVVFLSERTTAHEVALQLAEQLTRSLPAFASAREAFQHHTSPEELASLNAFQREVIRPLYWLPREVCQARLVFDGLDQLAGGTASIVFAGLDTLATDEGLPGIQVIVTSRPETPLPGHHQQYVLGMTDDQHLVAYVQRRQVPSALQPVIVQRAQGNWLVVRLLTDLVVTSPDADPGSLPPDLAGLYAKRLRDAGASDLEQWRTELRPVVSVLAAAGSGPVLPLQLLCAASAKLGGPARPTQVRDVFAKLRGFVVRAAPGTEVEHVGVFHPTFAEYILNPATAAFGITPEDPHGALAEAIEELAPMNRHDAGDPLHRYAAAREADHLWLSRAPQRTLDSLVQRLSVIPAENLALWQSWSERIRVAFGPDHPGVLATHHNIAYWTGETGDSQEALRLCQALLPDQERVRGPDHPDVLTTRGNIAYWTGATGDSQEALHLFQALLPDQERVLDPDHPGVLATRHNIARWTGATGDSREALRLFQDLLPDTERVLGVNHPDVLATRHNIAHWTGATGDSREALRLFQDLLPDTERVLGPDHPSVLATRGDIARWTGETGDSQEALRLCQALLSDTERVLGANHPDVLATRHNIARWTGATGDSREALRLFQALLPDQERVLGANHPGVLATRHDIAYWTGATGDSREALHLFQALLPDQERVLGANHPGALAIRGNIARWTGEIGDSQEALRLFQALLPDQGRVLGPDHPDVLTTRHNIARWTGETGDSQEALRLCQALLPDRERVLGPDHPDVLTTRHNIARWTGATGDSQKALRLFQALLPDQERVLGPDHPHTEATRRAIRWYQ